MDASWLTQAALAAYAVVLGILCIYGLHRYSLVYLFLKSKNRRPEPKGRFSELPHVTVQLPMYNEQYVAKRITERTCQIEYPRHLLEIQVLDDSTDETVDIARETVERMRALGHDVVYIHRDNRIGYKAGALREGTTQARGEFIAIFDADFLPPTEILRDTIHFFTDEKIGMVQSRWSHLNRDLSLLTQTQAILLDGHFLIEHTARNRSGRFMSFNGTAGIWRRSAIDDAGGWEHDTLTEDLDLSYRAQLRGWKFIFLPDLKSPAELPPEMNAFKAQQHRWTKGGTQTCVKLLPKVLRSNESWQVKLEACFHLTSGFVYILIVMLSVLIGPAIYLKLTYPQYLPGGQRFLDPILFFVGTCSALSFYICSQRQVHRNWFDCIRYIPVLMAVAVGIAFNNAVAAIEGLFGHQSEFVRTPKFGDEAHRQGNWQKRAGSFPIRGTWQAWAELALGLHLCAWLIACLMSENWLERVSAAAPFMLMFIAGYIYVSLQTFYGQWVSRRPAPATS